MRLLVSGASGFLGSAVVRAALAAGHEVTAAIRPTSRFDMGETEGLFVRRIANDDVASHVSSLADVDAVIHCAAAMGGDFETQRAVTVGGTQRWIEAMQQAGVERLVAVSTFSVFDYNAMEAGCTVDESAPLESRIEQRDAYARVKLEQENLCRRFEAEENGAVTIVRPGAIFGRDHLWNSRLGLRPHPALAIVIGGNATVPLCFVEHCAEALVLASGCDAARGETLHLVDDDLPTQLDYLAALAQRNLGPAHRVPIPWLLARSAASVAWRIFGRTGKLPGLAVPARLAARFKPLRYSNRRAKEVLGWRPRYSLTDALARCEEQSANEPFSRAEDTH